MVVPGSHPRKWSLDVRERLVEGFRNGLVADAGLIAHGRGEAFDYLLGERTREPAFVAIRAGVAALLLAENPVISVNGNVAALCPAYVVGLSESLDAGIEVNLFYHSQERVEKIIRVLDEAGARKVYGVNRSHRLEGLESERGFVDEALWKADAVLVMLEDGDRTERLVEAGKKVVCIDLNPLSRSAVKADITVVDNVVRCLPLMIEVSLEMKDYSKKELQDVAGSFSQENNLSIMEKLIRDFKRTG
ncbi:MAG TPA: phosphopantothenate/pantothenate synthetase [Candidatus Altiarchaeales archaeon]|nr:phosphopantothenate/pantothenate synthetase [Candidatus Altiarchaeales archaeon]